VRRFAPQLFAQLFGVALLLLPISITPGQTTGRPTSQQQVQNRDWARGNLRERVNMGEYERALERAKLAMRDDFRNLQLVNLELMRRIFKPAPAVTQKITNKEIRSSLGEIGKLAERLRLNFGFSKIKADLANEITLTPGLLRLDDAIVSFVENPFFQQPRVYDIELVSRAEKDLGEVLRLVDVLRELTK
jgi:hypothetical protein